MSATVEQTERTPHQLAELLAALPAGEIIAVSGPGTGVVDHFSQDSREVGAGGVFVATRGSSWDGHAFIATALGRGVRVIIAETPSAALAPEVTFVQVKDGLVALAWLSAAWFGHPGRALTVLATTGTNGKTTTTFLLRSILLAWGKKVGLISTVEIRIGETRQPTIFTTPPAPELQSLLDAMQREGCTHAVLEASSHGLHQHRIAAFPVAVAGFTNLTRDHLDYHGTMQAYLAAKERLFSELAERACISIDEPAGRHLAEVFRARRGPERLLTFSTRGEAASLSASEVHSDLTGVRANIQRAGGDPFVLTTPLIGRHNLENALTALGMALLCGVPLEVIRSALATAPGAPGRLQRVSATHGPSAIVDYAHTPDALANVLSALAPLVHARGGQLVCVFGAGGDRDHGKRPEMAATASRLADRVTVTTDNPRTEDPEAILDDIATGFPAGFVFMRITDRKRAIEAAIASARTEDVVLIAGKGHEDYQIIGTTKHPFDDVAVARAALEVWA